MTQLKALLINERKLLLLTQFVILMGAATTATLFKNQAISGSIINATLFFSVALLGFRSGILIAFIPSWLALFTGLLPIALAPMIPFIILGNIILVIIFNFFKNKSYWLGAIMASVLKFIFLFITSSMVINLFINKGIASNLAIMMSWPQLFTALSGSLIAYFLLKMFNFKQSKKN